MKAERRLARRVHLGLDLDPAHINLPHSRHLFDAHLGAEKLREEAVNAADISIGRSVADALGEIGSIRVGLKGLFEEFIHPRDGIPTGGEDLAIGEELAELLGFDALDERVERGLAFEVFEDANILPDRLALHLDLCVHLAIALPYSYFKRKPAPLGDGRRSSAASA